MMGSGDHGWGILGSISKQAEQDKRISPVSRVLPWPLL